MKHIAIYNVEQAVRVDLFNSRVDPTMVYRKARKKSFFNKALPERYIDITTLGQKWVTPDMIGKGDYIRNQISKFADDPENTIRIKPHIKIWFSNNQSHTSYFDTYKEAQVDFQKWKNKLVFMEMDDCI